jgi:hypothetical protein
LPVAANATNAVALVPGSFSAGLGFRGELGMNSGWVLVYLLAASLAGGLLARRPAPGWADGVGSVL